MVEIAILAVLTISGLQGHALRGFAVTARIPGAPHLGQCLLQTPADRDAAGSAGRSYRLGGCGTPHFGEVVDVSGDQGATDARQASCADPALFAGWAPPAMSAARVRWRPIALDVITMDPTPLQQSFGQHWRVCVLTPLIPDRPYTGSVRGALATGHLPLPFAECTADLHVLTGSIACDEPHAYEIFSSSDVPLAFRDQKALNADCRVIVAAATRMPDVTAGGRLRVWAVTTHRNAYGETLAGLPDNPSDLDASATCLVGTTAARSLHGSLFGLGAEPVPWTN